MFEPFFELVLCFKWFVDFVVYFMLEHSSTIYQHDIDKKPIVTLSLAIATTENHFWISQEEPTKLTGFGPNVNLGRRKG